MDIINVFVSYSHQDALYLEQDSLLGFLRGLEKDGVVFWTDRQIQPGEKWDEVIKRNLQRADIALVLVSQAFLDSDYCTNIEIKGFLSQKAHIFPIILSACDWRRHCWLAERQFLPGGDKTIEEHYQDDGSRKRLFLNIREALRLRFEEIRKAINPTPPPPNGITKVIFCKRLGVDWRDLADILGIPAADQARFERGDEGRAIWTWLENRSRLMELAAAAREIGRGDLAQVLGSGS